MKSYYNLEDAKTAVKEMSGDDKLTLERCLSIAECLTEKKHQFFYDDGCDEPTELFGLVKKVDCINSRVLSLDLMITFGGPNIWIKIDDKDEVTVKCFWGTRVEIKLGKIGITLDEVRDIYSYLVNK